MALLVLSAEDILFHYDLRNGSASIVQRREAKYLQHQSSREHCCTSSVPLYVLMYHPLTH